MIHMTNGISMKGKQGFAQRYQGLGETKMIRIPKQCVEHIETLLNHYNRLCVTHDLEFLDKIQTKIESGLESID
jgi:hypothetical protein